MICALHTQGSHSLGVVCCVLCVVCCVLWWCAVCCAGQELLLAQSYAKNMGLYGERVGALSVVCSW
jgi:hypothetical protein